MQHHGSDEAVTGDKVNFNRLPTWCIYKISICESILQIKTLNLAVHSAPASFLLSFFFNSFSLTKIKKLLSKEKQSKY